MKFISNTLYITPDDAEQAGFYKAAVDAKSKGRSSFDFQIDPDKKNRWIIPYESLTQKYKTAINNHFGNPYEFAGANQLKKHITSDYAAIQYLTQFRFNDGKALSEQLLKDYSTACNILNFLSKSDKKAVKQIGFSDKNVFFEAVILLIKNEGVDLPTSYRRLMEAMREYEANGAASVISKRLGNQNRTKVKDEVSLALLKKLIEHPNKLGDYFIAGKYNEWAKQNERELISKSTVGNYRREYEFELLAGRSGEAVYRDKYDKVVHRKRASAPLLLINSDDNVLDLYYIRDKENKKGHAIADYYHRYALYVVTDAYNDYPLGYAVGNTVTIELVKQAYRNAINHVKELTGENYLWHQIQTDRWGINPNLDSELARYFSDQTHFTPSKFKNSRNRPIEQSFSHKWHGILQVYKNYAGHNVTAKNKVNREAIELNKRDFPTIEQAPAQIADFIERVRRTVDERTGFSKQERWIEGWNAIEEIKKRTLIVEEKLRLFGKRNERTSRITNRGVELQVNSTKFIYDVPEADYIKFVGTTGNVIYDPSDMNQVLFTADEGRIRILCAANQFMPSALADFEEGDRHLLNVKLDEKKRINQGMINEREKRNELIEREMIDVESLLQAGVLSKEINHKAQISYASGNVKKLKDYSGEESLDIIDRL